MAEIIVGAISLFFGCFLGWSISNRRITEVVSERKEALDRGRDAEARAPGLDGIITELRLHLLIKPCLTSWIKHGIFLARIWIIIGGSYASKYI